MVREGLHALAPILPSVVIVLLVVLALLAARKLLWRTVGVPSEHQFRNELIMLFLTALAALIVLLVLPMRDTTRSQLLNLSGIVLSAGIALASTTFIGNAFAAMMLRAVGNFRAGDFIRVADHFGRVTERALFHTEIQTEDRDLTTLPNLYLVTHPVRVIRASGTIVSATVSLGYDIDHVRVERLLLKAVEASGLRDPYVHIIGLGDFSISYRFAGFLADVRNILSARSRLRGCGITALHADGIEIVSPTFMNTRAFGAEMQFVSDARGLPASENSSSAEDLAFDKADQAAALVKLQDVHGALEGKLKELGARLGDAPEEAKPRLERARDSLVERRDRLEETIRSWIPDDD